MGKSKRRESAGPVTASSLESGPFSSDKRSPIEVPQQNQATVNEPGTLPSRKRNEPEAQHETSVYVSPLKRVRDAIAREGNKRAIEGVEEQKAFITDNMVKGKDEAKFEAVGGIMLRLRLVWTEFSTVSTGPVIRLHFVDKRVTDPLDELHKDLRDNYNQNYQLKKLVESNTITGSIYGVDEERKSDIPSEGDIVCVRNLWGLRLFSGRACQFTTNVEALTVEPNQ